MLDKRNYELEYMRELWLISYELNRKQEKTKMMKMNKKGLTRREQVL